MKIALDPFMLRHVPLTELPAVVAELGYEYIELSPREDFTPFFLHPRANTGRGRGAGAPARRSSGGRWRSCCRSLSGKGSSCGSSRIRTTSWRTAAPRWT